ncbi:MAG: hypothetical protein U0869_17760 [Chloroflexota bacterium]
MPFADLLDAIMVMTVEPGWGGQRFITGAAPKARVAGELLARHGTRGLVHMDGGVNRDTAEAAG